MDKLSSKVYCQYCKVDTNHGVLFKHEVVGNQPDEYQWSANYFVAQCLGCDGITFVEENENEEMFRYNFEEGTYEYYSLMKVYPEKPVQEDETTRQIPYKEFNKVPELMDDLYREVVEARNRRMLFLAAAGLRMIVEAVCLDQNVEDGYLYKPNGDHIMKDGVELRSGSLQGKINGLVENSIVTPKHSQVLHQIRELGNVTVHQIEQPRLRVITQGIEIIEHLFTTIYDIDSYTISPKRRQAE